MGLVILFLLIDTEDNKTEQANDAAYGSRAWYRTSNQMHTFVKRLAVELLACQREIT